jgi:hypothetical protein
MLRFKTRHSGNFHNRNKIVFANLHSVLSVFMGSFCLPINI